MLINNDKFTSCPVLSLHIGGEIARIVEPIIDPDKLKIVGFKVEGKLLDEETGNILPVDSIREFSSLGMIIDSIDEFVRETDIIKIKKALEINFKLIGHKVVTKSKSKLGKVSGYVLLVEDWTIQQLIVQRPTFKALLDPTLVIHRKQILEVDDYRVVVKDEYEKAPAKAVKPANPVDFVPNFVNPFREPDFANDKKLDK